MLGLGASGVLLVSIVLAGWLGVVTPRRARYASQLRVLEAQIADFHEQRWERPVLRGEPVDGNAFERLEAAVVPFRALHEDPSVVAPVAGRDASAALRARLEHHALDLERYRAASQAAWSFGDYPVERGLAAEEIEYVPHRRARELLAARASLAGPGECVSIATDLVRTSQDLAAGRSLVGGMMLGVDVELVAAFLPRCLIAADADTRARAARELGILAEHPAPIGYAMEIEALSAGAMSAHLLRPLGRLPTDGEAWEVWWTATDVLDAWDVLARDAADRRRIGERYPADIADLQAWERGLASSGNPLLGLLAPSLHPYLRHDAATVTRVRMLLAMARLLAGEPPSILREPALFDAVTGRPIASRETEAGLELESPGHDGRLGDENDLSLLVPRAPATP